MELKIYNPTADGFLKAIDWNYEEIKQEVAAKVEVYKNMVYTESEVTNAKKDRASLNKFIQALENKRKEVKKQCLAPYEDFERKIEEVIAIVNEPIGIIDAQVNTFEEKKKAKKLEKIHGVFIGCGFPEWVNFDKIFNQKWLNVSYSFSKIQEEIEQKKVQIETDIATLSQLPAFAFEAIETYKTTLDLNKAITEGRRLADIQAKKEEAARLAELQKAQQYEQDSAEQAEQQNEYKEPNTAENTQGQPQSYREWVQFKAFINADEARQLAAFFKAKNIDFAPIV